MKSIKQSRIMERKDMIQEYLTAWIKWYYGNDPYPNESQNRLTWDQKMEAIRKINQIREILGR